jgi:hypothetical protein
MAGQPGRRRYAYTHLLNAHCADSRSPGASARRGSTGSALQVKKSERRAGGRAGGRAAAGPSQPHLHIQPKLRGLLAFGLRRRLFGRLGLGYGHSPAPSANFGRLLVQASKGRLVLRSVGTWSSRCEIKNEKLK